jgi:hypothetical protein
MITCADAIICKVVQLCDQVSTMHYHAVVIALITRRRSNIAHNTYALNLRHFVRMGSTKRSCN